MNSKKKLFGEIKMNIQSFKRFADRYIERSKNPVEKHPIIEEVINDFLIPKIQSMGYVPPKRIFGSLERSLLNQLDIDVNTGCWIFTGNRCSSGRGYGQLSVESGRKKQSTHRLAYELFYGEIPEGKIVRHQCHRKTCCNPEHLRVGTQKENIADMISAGRDNFYGYRTRKKKKIDN